MSEIASGATHAARAVGNEAVDVVIEYLLPLGAGVAGFLIGPAMFGGNSVIGSIWTAGEGKIQGPTLQRIGGAMFGILFAAIGYAFWHMGKRGGWILKILGRGVGGFFLGTAAGYSVYTVFPQSLPNGGIIDKFVYGAAQIAEGG